MGSGESSPVDRAWRGRDDRLEAGPHSNANRRLGGDFRFYRSGHNTLWIPFLGRMRKRACKEQVKNRRQGVALAARDSPATMLCATHGVSTWAISDGKQLC